MNTTTLAPTAGVHEEAGVDPIGAAHCDAADAPAVRERGPEIAVATLLMTLGGLVVFDSVRLGAGWADDGPQSGYFPFYIGLMLLASSAVVFLRAVMPLLSSAGKPAEPSPVFVEHEQLRLVMAMLVPACLYVAAMSVLGLYVASIALIGWFMRRHGGFGWTASTAVSLGVPLTFFLVFERWFLVPLPKGPLEQLLGF